MQDWDRIVFLALSVPLAVHQGYVGWQAWREGKYEAVLGAFLLAVVSIVLPIALTIE